MIGLYEYETATKEECINDLYDTLSDIESCVCFEKDWETLNRKGIRITNIAKRLQELGNE